MKTQAHRFLHSTAMRWKHEGRIDFKVQAYCLIRMISKNKTERIDRKISSFLSFSWRERKLMSLCRIMFVINHSPASRLPFIDNKTISSGEDIWRMKGELIGEIENSTMMGFTADELPSTGREQKAKDERK